MNITNNPTRKATPGKAAINIIDCSKFKPVVSPETTDAFVNIFSKDTSKSQSAIAELSTKLANDRQVEKVHKIGNRYNALAEWLCWVTNDLLLTESSGNKVKIPELTVDEVTDVMQQNEDCLTDFNDDAAIINLASLTIFSYLAERKQQPRARLSDYFCEVNDVVEMAA